MENSFLLHCWARTLLWWSIKKYFSHTPCTAWCQRTGVSHQILNINYGHFYHEECPKFQIWKKEKWRPCEGYKRTRKVQCGQDLTLVKFTTVVISPGSRQESSRVSSCSCHDQSTDHKCPVEYRSDGYETSVQEGPALILRLWIEGAESLHDSKPVSNFLLEFDLYLSFEIETIAP